MRASIVIGVMGSVLSPAVFGAMGSTEFLVGYGETATNCVFGGDAVQAARLVTADGGRVEKTGDGKWTVPANIRQAFHPLALDVKRGTVAFSTASGEVPANPVPAFVAETAAMWLDASVDSSLGKRAEGDACFVDNWPASSTTGMTCARRPRLRRHVSTPRPTSEAPSTANGHIPPSPRK